MIQHGYLQALTKLQTPQSKRGNVPCECSVCAAKPGIQYTSPAVHRQHLKTDRLRHVLPAGSAEVLTGSSVRLPSPPVTPDTMTMPSFDDAMMSNEDTDVLFEGDWDSMEIDRPARPHLSAHGIGTPSTPAGVTRIMHAEWTGAQVEDRSESLPPGIVHNDNWELDGESSNEENEDEPLSPPIMPSRESITPNLSAIPPIFPSQESATPSLFAIPLIPEHKRQENSPDPFRDDTPTAVEPFRSRSSIHPDHGVYMLYALVTWLHTQFHLPFRACNAMPVIAALIIESFGVAVSAPVTTTLPTVLKKLGVEPAIRVHPVCPKCLEVYPDSKDTPVVCSICQTNIFKTGRTHTGRERTEKDREPQLRYATRSLASQLAEIVSLPGMEDELDEWRKKARKTGEYDDFFDGAISRELKGHDGKPFFANDATDPDGPDHELRVGVTLGADW